MGGDTLLDVVVERDGAVVDERGHVAVAAQRADAVRDHEDACVHELLLEGCAAFLLEAVVADLGDLVDQIPVEGDGHADGEGEPRAHARGVSRNRHREEGAELGEVADEVENAVGVLAVDAGNEARVVDAGRAGVEASGEAERPGDSALGDDMPAVGALGTGNEAQERGLAGAVLADDGDVAALEGEGGVAEHVLAAAADLVGFADLDQADHVRPRPAAGSVRQRGRRASW